MKQGDRNVSRDETAGYGGMLSLDVVEEEENKLLSDNAYQNYNRHFSIMNFLKDGEKRIDFILAYVKTKISDGEDGKTNKFKSYRETYLTHLRRKGLVLEYAEPTSYNTANDMFKHDRYLSFKRKRT